MSSFVEKILSLLPEEVALFFDAIICDRDDSALPYADCWLFRTDHYSYRKKKSRNNESPIPMYYIDSKLYSAQRISLILFNHTDCVKKSGVIAMCGNNACVNPAHLQISNK
jgi:hypothetical protein